MTYDMIILQKPRRDDDWLYIGFTTLVNDIEP